MESPSSTVRRRAWINSSRQWVNQEGLDSDELPCNLPSASVADDDVFSDVSTGCYTGKIENWLLACGSEIHSDASQLSFESVLKAQHTDEELGLGADASLLTVGEVTLEEDFQQCPSSRRDHSSRNTSTPRQAVHLPSLNLGHSETSSCPSSFASNSPSSVSEVLQLCSEDAEETLYHLGFGCDEPQVTVRIPTRFFSFPSVAEGINFRLFLDSQLRRIREEDPSLSLASRFRQVQVLAEMANAFYSLYSHVSRTPVQKLATPEFSFYSSPMERIERFRSSVRSEPRSPVERLKDTVSKMCLYTGSPRGSDSTSPQPSPKKRPSVPDVVDVVLERVKTAVTKKLDLEKPNRIEPTVVVNLVMDGAEPCQSTDIVQTQQNMTDSDAFHNANIETDNNGVSVISLDSGSHNIWTSVSSSLSGETVIETDQQSQPELDAGTVYLNGVAQVTADLICLQEAESRHHESLCTNSQKTSTLILSCSETEHIDKSQPSPCLQAAASEPDEDSHTTGSLPGPADNAGFSQCSITLTGWDGDDVSSCPCNTPDSSHASCVSPVKSCEESCEERQSLYPNPLTHQGLKPVTINLQQGNSFELEEVLSAGEEDFGHLEITRTASLLPKVCLYKGEVARNDSMHSDSSGYADEEVSPSHR